MKLQRQLMWQLALATSLAISCASCQKTSSNNNPATDNTPADIESAYLSLSAEVQKEILGVEAIPVATVRKELLAKADTDGDGTLSEAEKSALKAQWKEMKEQLRAELKAALDSDKDGEVSAEEKKAGLEQLGQQVRTAIQDTLAEIRSAQEDARAKIKAACSQAGERGKPEEAAALKEGAGRSANAGPPDDLDEGALDQEIEKEMNACQTVVQEEKEKMRELLKASLEKLHTELDELKGKLGSIEEAQEA
ncbi:EF-hand domain-containing protein [Oligoflexus tunisiensis]|uniref:EF-hand domain-containing protein n=1 Tax=Oligoflexus tunisiensis TaxID=708132 RepID=UPI00114C8C65|nr:EF-hand domain-containing protein [Oligoflexus tunisiensis]